VYQYNEGIRAVLRDCGINRMVTLLDTVTGTEVTLYFSAATDYAQVYPTYRSGETDAALAARVKKLVDDAAQKGYSSVKADHLTDYRSLYNRMSLDVGQTSTEKPTDELIVAYKDGSATAGEKRLLEVMIFQYGRYLTIASSRENSILPANLQGVWNNRNNPPWMSDYHTNVNLQISGAVYGEPAGAGPGHSKDLRGDREHCSKPGKRLHGPYPDHSLRLYHSRLEF